MGILACIINISGLSSLIVCKYTYVLDNNNTNHLGLCANMLALFSDIHICISAKNLHWNEADNMSLEKHFTSFFNTDWRDATTGKLPSK